MNDLDILTKTLQTLMADGWASGPQYACCMSCAKYELIPMHDQGKPCVWFTDNDVAEMHDGNVTERLSFRISVLGDVAVVENALRIAFGNRIGRVSAMTHNDIGFVTLFAQGQTEDTYFLAFLPTTPSDNPADNEEIDFS